MLFRSGYEGETSKSKVEDNKNIIFVKFVKDNEVAKRKSTELETSKTMIYNETIENNQQPLVTKNETKRQSIATNSCAPKDELKKIGRCQRRFLPPVRSITCFACHKPGHIVAYCKIKQLQSNQQKMQQTKGLPQSTFSTRDRYYFHGYCFYCKGFGHKAMECRTCI